MMKEALLVCRDKRALRSELRNIVGAILAGQIKTEADLELHKKEVSSRLGLPSLPSNADILGFASTEERERLKMLVRKPTRTLSGVAVIAAMTSPARCPHGVCIPCPGGVGCESSSPQSYTGREPAAMRAAQHNFDPYDQVKARLSQLDEIGHPLDKAELIIMGGTITSRPIGYQHWFLRRCLEAMNDYPGPHGVRNEWQSFAEVAAANETAPVRNVGTTFETRPDWCRPEQIERMLYLGATKVELGVQSTLNSILERMRRGHTVEDTIEANTALREAGLKVGFHMMPGLPGFSPDTDLNVFKDLFECSSFRPDYLKIYPTLVVQGTKLYKMYLKGEYCPIGDEEAALLVSRVKALLPRYVRLQRVQRDIPAHLIVAGVKKSNLRQLAGQRLKERREKCQCIRCREAGLRGVSQADIELKQEVYQACGADEHFLSYESQDDTLVGFLRLRLGFAARVRELHVYGPMVPIGARNGGWQHRGYGASLVKAAEEIARDAGYCELAVTSGIGARAYYRRLGYESKKHYMVKTLKKA
jgi:elongator complex protein 3